MKWLRGEVERVVPASKPVSPSAGRLFVCFSFASLDRDHRQELLTVYTLCEAFRSGAPYFVNVL